MKCHDAHPCPAHLNVASGDEIMELAIDEKQAKRLLKEIVIELVQEQHDLFLELMVEVVEETGMARAIHKGRQSSYVTEIEIRALLEGEQ
jgi:hypothetical protein